MRTPAYIAIADDGHITLFWGNGTEEKKHPILRGPQPASSEHLLTVIEGMKAWAEENGYQVVVPSYDLEVPDIQIGITDQDAENLDEDEIIDLLTDILDLDEDEDR
ncbi:MAG: hypothetical protein JXQ72_13155 [Anaerolineae bacterium]|nr:hypothetical protein [Anaerolineae bacterium]